MARKSELECRCHAFARISERFERRMGHIHCLRSHTVQSAQEHCLEVDLHLSGRRCADIL
jgi:phosphoribosylaminoimidazole carboxylase (NCAIR synthetase)